MATCDLSWNPQASPSLRSRPPARDRGTPYFAATFHDPTMAAGDSVTRNSPAWAVIGAGAVIREDAPGRTGGLLARICQGRYYVTVVTNSAGRWLLLIYTVPREPSANRVSIWRKLRRLGAILLHDAVWVLPRSPRTA